MDETPSVDIEIALENLVDDIAELESVLNELIQSLKEYQKAIQS